MFDAAFYDGGYFVDGGARAGYANYEADERIHRGTARSRLKRVAAAGVTSGRLVDVGTAVGYLPDEARRMGFEPAAVEVSSWAGDRARARDLRVESSMTDLADLRRTIDAVTFFQVLEHMPDLRDALRQAFLLLRPGGVLVCETWDASSRTARWAGHRWQQLSPPSVLWLFDPSSMRRLLEELGFEVVSWRATPKAVSLATVLGQTVDPSKGGVNRVLGPVVSRTPVPYFLDDLVTFAARRPVE